MDILHSNNKSTAVPLADGEFGPHHHSLSSLSSEALSSLSFTKNFAFYDKYFLFHIYITLLFYLYLPYLF